jgi:adrenodoxin-NADP+ reductase
MSFVSSETTIFSSRIILKIEFLNNFHLNGFYFPMMLFQLIILSRTKMVFLRRLSKLSRLSRCIQRDVHIAIVGSGPAGFYSAKYLLDKDQSIKIDILEKLPSPFGLVRFGVAPDHPEVKSVASQFTELFNQNSRLRYFGNVEIIGDNDFNDSSNGRVKVPLRTLQKNYDAILLSYGAASDTSLNIPGENLAGVLSARAFVNWYNGHPDYQYIGKQLDLSTVSDVVVIGQGNVAVDCARILAMRPSELETTDIATDSLEQLRRSKVKKVTLLGRRGHIQAAFTIKELREVSRLQGVAVKIDQQELKLSQNEASLAELKDSRPKKRIVELIQSISESFKEPDVVEGEPTRQLDFRFLLSPKEFIAENSSRNDLKGQAKLSAVLVERNTLTGEAFRQSVVGSGEMDSIPAQLALVSIGYRSNPLAGVPFNWKTHTIPHERGRVTNNVENHSSATDSSEIKGLYVSGWLKRGPSGIIGTNIMDAKETVATMLEDIAAGVITSTESDPCDQIPALRDSQVVTWNDYLGIERDELAAGELCIPSRPRVKFVSQVAFMESVARHRNEE